jgi:hypothetical protein
VRGPGIVGRFVPGAQSSFGREVLDGRDGKSVASFEMNYFVFLEDG